jgi:hypothetical protein
MTIILHTAQTRLSVLAVLSRNKTMHCYCAGGRLYKNALFSIAVLSILSVGNVSAQEPTVAGLNDLVVYDPGAHERGLPSPQFVQTEYGDGLRVDIPPAIHVHRYYYSGDKEFQGPIINGGPTVVVANHPKTGERMYFDVVLPAGAPRIAHNKHSITYIYPDKRVAVKFHHFPLNSNQAAVKIQNGKGLGRNIHEARENVSEHVKEGLANSPVIQSGKECAGEMSDFLHGVKVTLGDLSSSGADGLKTLSNMIPGVTYLKSKAEQEPQKDYANSIRAAGIKKARDETPFVPTNR